ncbi:MAG: hypothetical protein HQK50_02210 [Oligoflexia bacterium]|nr:hypothetical protein [Oligoflexia bacterium]MBF0364353.1 hypothetical protein [Oligoflexia bacterium]
MTSLKLIRSVMASLLLCALFLFSIPNIHAALFNINMTVEGVNKQFGYAKFEDVVNAIKSSSITNNFPNYTGAGSVTVALDFRGLPMDLSFGSGGTNDLVLSIPSINLSQTFSGTSRDDSKEQFKNWLKRDGQATLNAVMKKLAEVSPFDPVAGNPTSLMSTMVANDFGRGFVSTESSAATKDTTTSEQTTTSGEISNLIGAGIRIGQYQQAGLKGRSYTLPLSYAVRFKSDPRKQLIFDLPLTYFKLEESKSYNIGLGASFRLPVAPTWTITPSLATGVVGSVDMASAGQVASAAVTSSYTWTLPLGSLTMGNMLGYYKTLKFKVQGYESNPHIANTVLRNGVMYSLPHKLFKWDSESELFLIDTRYFGSELYMEQYNEIGFSLGSVKSRADLAHYLRAGVTYLFSSKTKGISVNFGYSF